MSNQKTATVSQVTPQSPTLLIKFNLQELKVLTLGECSGIICSKPDNLQIHIWPIRHNQVNGRCHKADKMFNRNQIGPG